MKKLAWLMLLWLVATLSACGAEHDPHYRTVSPTLDPSVPWVYKTDTAAVIRYFDPLQCPSTGKVTVTIQPDHSARLEVVSPDVASKYVDKVGGATKCDETGDLFKDTFYGLYDPATKAITFKACDGDMFSRGDMIYISDTNAGGKVYCGFTVDGKYELWVSASFTSASLSK